MFQVQLGSPELLTGDADKSLARSTSRCILFDGQNTSFDAILVVCVYICIYIYK